MENTRPALLVLADGSVFRGHAFGADGERQGEVVFNTSMTGYQEIATDPSNAAQIVCMTYPHIGNYGVNADDVEAAHPWIEGMVVRELSPVRGNFRATEDLGAKQHATRKARPKPTVVLLGNCDIDGDAISGEPEWSASLNSEYYFPLDDTEVYIRALYKYTDERDNTEASAGLGLVDSTFDATNIVNLYTGWRAANQQWDVSVWVKNLTDEDSVTFQQGPDQYDLQLSGGSYTQANILQERTIGVTARYSF